jgi:predicted GIY-YIG superfamily endonuclease
MKNWKTYVLKDSNTHEIVYVGMTGMTLEERLRSHKTNKKYPFYKRNDIYIQATDYYDTKQEALEREAVIKFMLGFRDKIITDRQMNGKIAGKIASETGQIHRIQKLLVEKQKKPVLAYKTTGEYVGKYNSQNDAAKELNCIIQGISLCINGTRKQHKGYIFKRT